MSGLSETSGRYHVERVGDVWLVVDGTKSPPEIMHDTVSSSIAYGHANTLNAEEQPPIPNSDEAVSGESLRDRMIYQITTGSGTVSTKIRQLHRLQVSTSDIAKHLRIRYQQVHNVIAKGVPAADPSSLCRVCGRPLTDEVSKALGIGPVCAGHSTKKERADGS